MNYTFEPIGILKTCFKEKFGIPRQSGLVTEALGVLKLRKDPHFKNAVRELEGFSHVWVIFVFHQQNAKAWKPSIRPPRLGGAKKVGVLASRSPHRPNPIGLSVVKLEKIDLDAPGGIEITFSGVDILDGTPVLDIKPYLAYADSIPRATSGWAGEAIARTEVELSPAAVQFMESVDCVQYPRLRELILEMIELDPRPASQKRKAPTDHPDSEGTYYGIQILDFDVRWKIQKGRFYIYEIIRL